MKDFISNPRWIQRIQAIASRVASFVLILGVMVFGIPIDTSMSTGNTAIAAPFLPTNTNLYQIAQLSNSPADLERAADKAEEASENVYKGLDTTKAVVGKTEKRNQVIEEAREHGSDKWKSLAEKARAASRSDESLSPVDELNLKRLLESEPNQ